MESLIQRRSDEIPQREESTRGKKAHWASSNYGEEEQSAKYRDRKFEGYSELKRTDHVQVKQKKSQQQQQAHQLQEEYILNLQKQIVLMEQELKLLKEREVEQRNQVSGYETLLKDGIPLNEHFIALKNKFNKDKEDEEKRLRNLNEDIKHDEDMNREKKHKIEILKHEFENITRKYEEFKKVKQARIEDLEAKVFDESHNKDHLTAEKEHDAKLLDTVQGENIHL